MVVTVAFLATPARNRLAHSAITVFSLNTFALTVSLHTGGEHRVTFKGGLSA